MTDKVKSFVGVDIRRKYGARAAEGHDAGRHIQRAGSADQRRRRTAQGAQGRCLADSHCCVGGQASAFPTAESNRIDYSWDLDSPTEEPG